MKPKLSYRYFRKKKIVVTLYFLVFGLILLRSQTSAFHSSPTISYKRISYKNNQSTSRDISDISNNVSFHTRSNKSHTHVLWYSYRPQDNLFSGIAEIGMAFSIGVLYSEYFIIVTGCGPPDFGDTLERICYQGVIVYAGVALFNRIVTQFSSGLEDTVNNMYGPLQPATLWQVRVAEYLSAMAVVGAFLTLQVQYSNGVSMDGLSGIDVSMCRAIRGDM